MKFIIGWFDALHPFFQNICAAAAFAIVAWLVRVIASKIKRSGSEFFTAYQKMELYKHLIHKELIKSDQLIRFSKGYFIVTLESFRWAFRGVVILVFFVGVAAIVAGNWWMVIGYWFLLNCMLEASTWLKDKSSEREISYIKQEIKDEFYKIAYPTKRPNEEPNKQIQPTAEASAD